MKSWLTDRVVAFLARQRRVSSFQRAVRILEVHLAQDGEFWFGKLVRYSLSPHWVARYLAARNLPRFLSRDEEGVENLLKALAEDDHPLVREGVAWGLAYLLEFRLPETLGRCARWSRDPSEAVRRAAMMAAVPLIRKPDAGGRVERLMGFLEGFLDDSSPAIRREMVRDVVGRVLLEAHPELTVRRLHRWLSQERPERDRQISYLLLASPLIDQHPGEAFQLVQELAARPDPAPVVRTRATLALRRLQDRWK